MPNTILHHGRVLAATLGSTLNAWRGTNVVHAAVQPAKPLQLYDIEACPYCRAVREALTALHLDVEVYPCPKGGKRFRPTALAEGGKYQFPLLVDPNTDSVLYESAAIIDYLFRTYADRPTPRAYRPGPLRQPLALAASLTRGISGLLVSSSLRPVQLLHLWSFESSPFSKPVRERLCELELPYVLHNLGKEQWADLGPAKMRIKPGEYKPVPGGKRDAFLQRHGRVQVPYLEDPNTGAALFESAAILEYLQRQYAR